MVNTGLYSGILALIVLLGIIPIHRAYTFYGKANITTTVTGRPLLVCDYNGLQWTEGTVLFADKCTKVTCKGGYFDGAGYGISAGVFGLPEGCYKYRDGCNPLFWTNKDGQNVTCFGHKRIPGMND